jgi:hypothetical protein
MRPALAVLWLLAAAPLRAAPIGYEILAREGAAPPGLPDARIEALGSERLNEAGEFAYFAYLEIGPGGVTADDARVIVGPDASGAPAILAREGDPVPGAPAYRYRMLKGPLRLNQAGQIAFPAQLQELAYPFLAPSGFLGPAPATGELTLLARQRAWAPGVEAFFQRLEDRSLSLADDGRIAFSAVLDTQYTEVPLAEASGVWGPDAGGALTRLLHHGEQVPGAAPGVLFDFSWGLATLLGSGGLLALSAIENDSVTTGGVWGVDAVLGPVAGAPALLARVSDPLPGLPPSDLVVSFGVPPQMDANGRVALVLSFACEPPPPSQPFCSGVFRSDGQGGLEAVAVTGQGGAPAESFESVGDLSLTDAGTLVFYAWSEAQGETLWRSEGAELERVVGDGDPVPGGGEIEQIRGFQANDAGQVALFAGVSDGFGYEEALLLADDLGLRVVARSAEPLELDGLSLTLTAWGPPYDAQWFNDAGELLFTAYDEEGAAVLLRAVPEPAAAWLLAGGAAALLGTRSLRRR